MTLTHGELVRLAQEFGVVVQGYRDKRERSVRWAASTGPTASGWSAMIIWHLDDYEVAPFTRNALRTEAPDDAVPAGGALVIVRDPLDPPRHDAEWGPFYSIEEVRAALALAGWRGPPESPIEEDMPF